MSSGRVSPFLEDVRKAKTASGRNEYLKFLEEGTITLGQAVKAKCFDCCGYYEDGKVDCGVADCPLYPWMPFGKAKKERAKKPRTEAQIKASQILKGKRGASKQV